MIWIDIVVIVLLTFRIVLLGSTLPRLPSPAADTTSLAGNEKEKDYLLVAEGIG